MKRTNVNIVGWKEFKELAKRRGHVPSAWLRELLDKAIKNGIPDIEVPVRGREQVNIYLEADLSGFKESTSTILSKVIADALRT